MERTETLVTSSENWSIEGDREDADVGIGVGVGADVGVCVFVCVEIMEEERTKRHETGEKKREKRKG